MELIHSFRKFCGVTAPTSFDRWGFGGKLKQIIMKRILLTIALLATFTAFSQSVEIKRGHSYTIDSIGNLKSIDYDHSEFKLEVNGSDFIVTNPEESKTYKIVGHKSIKHFNVYKVELEGVFYAVYLPTTKRYHSSIGVIGSNEAKCYTGGVIKINK